MEGVENATYIVCYTARRLGIYLVLEVYWKFATVFGNFQFFEKFEGRLRETLEISEYMI